MTSPLSIRARAIAAGITPNTVYNRIARGWPLEQAFTVPAHRYGVVVPAVFKAVQDHPDLPARELAKLVGEPTEVVRMALNKLTQDERVIRSGYDGTWRTAWVYRENPD